MNIRSFRLISRCIVSFSRSTNCFHSTLLCVEHENGQVNPSTGHTLSASQKIGGEIFCLVAGHGCNEVNIVANTVSKFIGISKVLVASSKIFKHPLVEPYTNLIVSLQKQYNFSHISMSASSFGKAVIPRVAGKLNVAPISEITGIMSPETYVRTVYASNAILTITSTDALKLFTVRSTAFPTSLQQDNCASVDRIESIDQTTMSEWKCHSLSLSNRPQLSSAKIVISGGRGLKSGDNFNILYKLAGKMGAAVGASRAAVDAGFVSNELQVGQTGKIVAPQLYIAVGISGAIQHLAGMKDSKTIVAINKDPDAPIFQVADYGLVADLFRAIPELIICFEK
ncbi:Electron transfer flavoprotein subunit alpha, mitochondrial [Oopsacas minuta]|uniref:Electron transfer flavoprotein subunit alpha n=1 Tax=Oopsacas minuta TaxID=111878 RepID=A0AAV7JC68_9METZ|nr:Electron transfer flavoprotein subunit alpha, mitochondrial [Oopsacas minuta]